MASGSPHGNRAACASDGSACGGTCTGLSSGQCSFPTGNCGAGPTCSSANSSIGQAVCTNGSCVAPAAEVCTNGLVCFFGTCDTECFGDKDCQSGYFCETGSCRLPATQVATGAKNSFALLSDGSVFAWGANSSGQLGPAGPTSTSGQAPLSNVPIRVTSLGKAKAIAAGDSHVCALLSDGTVWCWGAINQGEVGNGQVADSFVATPVQVSGLPAGVTAIAASGNNSCAVVGSTGAVYCWGDNTSSQLGSNASGDSVGTPVMAAGIGSFDTAVATGGGVTCAFPAFTYCWGNNGESELAKPASAPTTTPTFVSDGGDSPQQMAVAHTHTCELRASGGIYCWGLNELGDLGDKDTAVGSVAATPVKVDGLSTAAVGIASGYLETCAALLNGTVWCWGSERSGALGNGVTSSDGYSASPVQVSGISAAKSVAVAELHGCALNRNGSIQCWGVGGDGELGNGSSVDSSVPVTVSGW